MKAFVAMSVAAGAWLTFHAVGGLDYQPAPAVDKMADARAAVKAKVDCRANVTCWADVHIAVAEVRCRSAIERRARFQYEWTGKAHDVFSDYRWSKFGPGDGSGIGVVTYVGDKVKFQNRFGAWSPMVYECDYNPETQDVIDVRLKPGRV